MTDNQQSHSHQQDNCQDCQHERIQNNRLVEFYEQLGRMSKRAASVKVSLSTHTSQGNKHAKKLLEIGRKITNTPAMNSDTVNSNNMGYQLAVALIQRDIRMRKQNQVLQGRITDVKQRKNSLQSTKTQLNNNSSLQSQSYVSSSNTQRSSRKQSKLSDSLDKAVGPSDFWTTASKKNKADRHQSALFISKDSLDSNTSFMGKGQTALRKNEDSLNSDSMNLWLYQYEAENIGWLSQSVKKRSLKY